MASSNNLFLFFFALSLVICAASKPKATAIHFAIRKNQTSLLYYVPTEFGDSSSYVDALLDLGAQYVWFDCTSYNLSSYKPEVCRTDRCKQAKGIQCLVCSYPPNPGCFRGSCGTYAYNPLSTDFAEIGLGQDTMTVYSTDGNASYHIRKFRFYCAESSITHGLPGDHIKGVVGLGRTRVSLPAQVSSSFNFIPKFSLCLPGDLFIGMPPSNSIQDQSTTPLLINPFTTYGINAQADRSDEYFIGLKGIEVGGKRIALNSSLLSNFYADGSGGTKISTVEPYTTLQPSIYKSLIEAFTKAAAVKKMKRVKSVAPFEACFDSETVPKTITGPAVPDIDLVLEGLVRLRLYGSSSMVEAVKNVICLAFLKTRVDGNTHSAIILGGHQLEDRLLVFDLSTSRLGFTPSLLLSNTSCSQSRSKL